MPLHLPNKRRHGKLSALHVNDLNRVGHRAEMGDSNRMGLLSLLTRPHPTDYHQRQAIVVSESYPVGQADYTEGLYEIRFRYYPANDALVSDNSSSSSYSSQSGHAPSQTPTSPWETDDDGYPHFMDAREANTSFSVDQRALVYFDKQRGMWLPVNQGTGDILVAKSDAAISKGDSGTFSIYDGTSPVNMFDTNRNKEAYMRIGSIKINKWAYLRKINTWWEAFPWEC